MTTGAVAHQRLRRDLHAFRPSGPPDSRLSGEAWCAFRACRRFLQTQTERPFGKTWWMPRPSNGPARYAPLPPCQSTIEERCRRLPLISTSVWSGARLRSMAGRTTVDTPLIGWVLVLNDGMMVRRLTLANRMSMRGGNHTSNRGSVSTTRPCSKAARARPAGKRPVRLRADDAGLGLPHGGPERGRDRRVRHAVR